MSDDEVISENGAATLNWIDEPNKDKIFALRHFECDANIYMNIKEVVSSGPNPTQQQIANFVKRITLLKQKTGKAQHHKSPPAYVIQKPAATVAPTQASMPTSVIATSQAPRHSIVNGIPMQQPASVRTSTPNVQILRSAIMANGNPAIVFPIASTSVASSAISTISTMSNATPYPTVSSAALHTAPNLPQSAQATSAAYTQSTQSIGYAPSGPQLLDLPQRSARFRSRAYSMYFESNPECNPMPINAAGRRQSIGNNASLVQPMQLANANGDAQRVFDHTYTRPTMTNTSNFYIQTSVQRPTPTYITKIHAPEIIKPCVPNLLKVLTPDDLNSRK